MAEIDLYVDPVCPFTWVTTRWLLDNSDEHTVVLRQMSLAVLNGEDADAGDDPMLVRSRRFGRVFAAVTRRGGNAAFASLYLALGPLLHPRTQDTDDDAAVGAALEASGVDAGVIDALDDSRYDSDIGRAHDASQAALGGSGGSPIISIDGHSFNGPVLTTPPPPGEAAALLRAIITAATTPGFAALQRPYSGPPDFTPHAD